MLNKAELFNSASRAFHKAGFLFKKHSPEILVVGGVITGVTSAVMACKATTKLDGILEDHHAKVEKIHEVIENPELLPEKAEYTVEDSKKDIAIVYAQTGVELLKLYGPAIGLGVVSVTAILAGHGITRKRNTALAAAYTAVDKSFKEYRGRVVERFGEALDKELKYNIKTKEIEEIVTNEDGTETIVKKKVDVVDGFDDPNNYSVYAKFFDDGCNGWTKDPEFNLKFLRDQQRFANERLKARGYLFLNEVHDMLGIPRTEDGQVVGWIYDLDNPNGDNCVDFGIYDTHRQKSRDFVNGYERTILLDFNVDGYIANLI